MIYSYGYKYSGITDIFRAEDMPGLKGLYEPDDSSSLNALLAADFVRVNSESLTSSSTDFNKGDEDFSWGCWVKFDSTGTGMSIIGKWGNTSGNKSYLLYKNSSDEVNIFLSSDGTTNDVVLPFGTVSSGTWYFVVGVHDSVNNLAKISVNGADFKTASFSGGVYNSGTPYDFEIGNLEGTVNELDGQIDAPFFYDRALSLAEVKALYNSGNGIDYSLLTQLNGDGYSLAKNCNLTTILRYSGSNLKFGNENFSFGGWIKTPDTTARNYIRRWGAAGFRSFLLNFDTNEFVFFLSNDGTATTQVNSGGGLSANTWYFVGCVYDADNDLMKISINGGAFVTQANSTGAYSGVTSTLDIVSGSFDGTFFYDKALSQLELQSLYNSSNGKAYSDLTVSDKVNLLSYYDMNTTDGADVSDLQGANDLTDVNSLSVSTIGKANDYTVSNIESDLVSWWKLNEASGVRYDAIGTNDLTDNNTVGYATGKIQEELINSGEFVYSLDDVSGNGNLALQSTVTKQMPWELLKQLDGNGTTRTYNIDNLQAALASDTVGFFGGWFYFNTALQVDRIIGFGDTNANEYIVLQKDASNKIQLVVRPASGVAVNRTSDSALLTPSIWHHILVVADGTTIKFYYNGLLVASTDAGVGTGDEWFSDCPNIDNGRIGALNFNSGGDGTNLIDGSFGQIVAGSLVPTDSFIKALYQEKLSIYS